MNGIGFYGGSSILAASPVLMCRTNKVLSDVEVRAR
jgi:hypothetical protein